MNDTRFHPTTSVTLDVEPRRIVAEAEAYGQWAVHLAVEGCPAYNLLYSVSHIPTGRCARRLLALDNARSTARRFDEQIPHFTKLAGPHYQAARRLMKEIKRAKNRTV